MRDKEQDTSSMGMGMQDDREKHKIKCSDCGKDAEVPFKPTEGKPVYCRDCFMKRRQDRPRRFPPSRGGSGRRF